MFGSMLYYLFGYQVLYKSRCDNRLNEITERAAADKREVSPCAVLDWVSVYVYS